MKWWVAVAMFAAGAALVGAQGPPTTRSHVEQYELFQKNKAIVQLLVETSVEMTTQNDPLKRAETAQGVVRLLSSEIKASKNEPSRVVELGGHLRKVLNDGIIPNIRMARGHIQPGSEAEKRLFAQCQAAEVEIDTVAAELGDAPAAQFREVRDTLDEFRKTRTLIANP